RCPHDNRLRTNGISDRRLLHGRLKRETMIVEENGPLMNSTEGPTKSALVKATGIALLVALVLLFTAILPAEYGFDPLKTGTLLGLTGLSQTPEVKKGAAPTPAPGKTGVFRAEAGIYKVESEDFSLRPGEGMEMKY